MIKACATFGDRIWTMTYTVNFDQTITIGNFDPEDNDGYMFNEQFGKIERFEQHADNTLDAVTIDGVRYDVKNKQPIASYRQPL